MTLIVAMDRDGAIGKDGAMPWHLPAELKHFKESTWGKPLLMGRKTHAAIGRALPGRQNIVLTRDPEYPAPGCVLAGSLEAAIASADGDEIMVIGGAEIYALTLPLAKRLLITEVDTRVVDADVFFPALDRDGWQRRVIAEHPADERNRYAFKIVEFRRAPGRLKQPSR